MSKERQETSEDCQEYIKDINLMREATSFCDNVYFLVKYKY